MEEIIDYSPKAILQKLSANKHLSNKEIIAISAVLSERQAVALSTKLQSLLKDYEYSVKIGAFAKAAALIVTINDISKLLCYAYEQKHKDIFKQIDNLNEYAAGQMFDIIALCISNSLNNDIKELI